MTPSAPLPLLPKGSLIVSCQAPPPSPFEGPHFMAAFADAAALGGAAGLRVNGPGDIRAVKLRVDLPVIGLNKIGRGREAVFITPSLAAIDVIAEAGADIIALDATQRKRPAEPLDRLFAHISEDLGLPIFADIGCVAEGEAAAAAGADYIGTTLAGNTGPGAPPPNPDFDLIEALAGRIDRPIIAEGRLADPDDVRRAFAAGAHAVVVGTAITNPIALTARFAAACPAAGTAL